MQGRRDFVILGFTGPICAGCTTAAKFFSDEKTIEDFIKNNFLESKCLECKIYELYKEMMSSDLHSRERYKKKKELEEKLKKREFIKILHQYYNENSNGGYYKSPKFRFKYISFSEILIQEIMESILFYNLENEIQNFFPKNKKYVNIISYIHKISIELLKEYNINIKSLEECWKTLIKRQYNNIKKDTENVWCKFKIYLELTSEIMNKIKKYIEKYIGMNSYIEFLQDIGTLIRWKGSFLYKFISNSPHPVYSLAYRINLIIKFFRHYDEDKYNRFVIEAFRNPFEVEFFRQRYYEFYLFSLFAPFNIRQKRCSNINELQQRDKIDQGFEFLEDADNLRDKFNFIKNFKDEILSISMQNTQKCVQLSDININNESESKEELYKKLLFYYTLILQPGYVPPTADETLMNMAYMLSLQSTCICRQVGAIITEEDGYIVGAGWNDVSKGQIGCGLRWRNDCEQLDNKVLPLHPESKRSFRSYLKKKNYEQESFCFKDEYSNYKNSESKTKALQYCRALHAEENAILQTAKVGGIGLKKASTIYSTTFPCELCAKKIYQVGIDRVVYVEPYPKSISEEVFFKDGVRQPKIEQFEGVKPHSYYRLYKPVMDKKEWQNYLKIDGIKELLLS